MRPIQYDRWFKWFAFLPTALISIAGCGGGESNHSNPVSLSSFNLATLSASVTDIKQVTFNWTRASDEQGVTYRVCQKSSSHSNGCDILATVSNSSSTTVNISSLVEALKADYFIMASNDSGNVVLSNEKSLSAGSVAAMVGYIKASNTKEDDGFGFSIALSADGATLAVGARDEDTGATGIETDGSEVANNAIATSSGAVYLFSKSQVNNNQMNNKQDRWVQTAYVKASNANSSDYFGYSVSLNSDGSVLAVGAPGEDSNIKGVLTDGSEVADASNAHESGAVYLFSRTNGSWVQSAYVKASNTDAYDEFGRNVVLSGDGLTLAITALGEDNAASGVITDGSEVSDSNMKLGSSAVYLFSRSSGNWMQTAYVKASNPDMSDFFGYGLALSRDGQVMAVGARGEDNAVTGVITDGSEVTDTGAAENSGAVYLFNLVSNAWKQTAYIKPSNTSEGDNFGQHLSLNANGSVLAVGATGEDNGVSGVVIDGSEVADTGLAPDSGAVYLFGSNSGNWAQVAYLKASNSGSNDYFGSDLELSDDGKALVVGSYGEDGGFSGVTVDGSETLTSQVTTNSGAAYLFGEVEDKWVQSAYVKASNPGVGDFFGRSVSMSKDATTLAVSALNEDNAVKGIVVNGTEVTDDGLASDSGAVYLY